MVEKQKKGFFMMNFNRLLVLFFILAMVGCGDGDSSDDTTVPGDPSVPTDPSVPAVTSNIALATSLPTGDTLAQGGTTTITATVYNDDGNFVADGTQVAFTKTAGIITGSVPTVSGKATATYNAASAGGDVTITAAVGDVSSQITLTVASGSAAWIELVSITPNRLGLKGTGLNEVGSILFNVKDAGGNAVADGTQVDFSLDSPTGGGEYVSPSTALTVGGEVAVSLVSGVVGGVATVTATTNAGTIPVSTEARVTMGYGKPDQLHLSIFYDKLNVPGLIEFNVPNTISAAVADRYSNPVPAGTPVYFASECGIVSLDNNLTDATGVTSVGWITANPVATDGYCTSIIWTEGEEAYIDTNGNGAYDLGEPHTPIGEPFIDANENGSYDLATETYFDLDENGIYTGPDAVWDADTFVWVDGTTRYSDYTAAPVISPATFNVTTGGFQDFDITIADVNGGPLPAGSSATVSTNCSSSSLAGDTDITIEDAVNPGPETTYFSVRLSSTDTVSGNGAPCSLTVVVTATPNGTRSTTINGNLD